MVPSRTVGSVTIETSVDWLGERRKREEAAAPRLTHPAVMRSSDPRIRRKVERLCGALISCLEHQGRSERAPCL